MFMLLQKPRIKQTKIKDSDAPENDGRGGQDSVSEYPNENLCPMQHFRLSRPYPVQPLTLSTPTSLAGCDNKKYQKLNSQHLSGWHAKTGVQLDGGRHLMAGNSDLGSASARQTCAPPVADSPPPPCRFT